jgi:hypothetical protein
VLKKPYPKNAVAASDVPADNPSGTMQRFTEGLRRVLAHPKYPELKRAPRRKRPT